MLAASPRHLTEGRRAPNLASMRPILSALLVLLAAACGAPAPERPASPPAADIAPPTGLEVRDAWASATPGGVNISAGYFTIANGGSADRLVLVSSPRAARVEVHEMSMKDGMMRMRRIEGGLAVPARSEVMLTQGGLHLMFIGITEPFAPGEEIAVTLNFENAGAREVRFPVRTR